jgi:uncharacterized membrane protein YeaQ/YmgE (transglycosylase-associated protein family)
MVSLVADRRSTALGWAEEVNCSMVVTVSITLDPGSLLVWAFVGLVAGFLASKVMIGHGMGLLTDIVVGIAGALVAGFLAKQLGISFNVPDHPIVSEIIIAFVGAMLLLFVLRLLGLGRHRRLR